MVKFDVIVIGSGAGGLTAAFKAAKNGLRVLVVEKRHQFGGSSAMSGGTVWAPNSRFSKQLGLADSFEEGLQYMEGCIGNEGSWCSTERKKAYIENVNEAMEEMAGEGVEWIPARHYPDYYPELPGGKTGGRSIDASFFELKKLGEWAGKIHDMGIATPFPIHSGEVGHLPKMLRRLSDLMMVSKIFLRSLPWMVTGKKYLSNGQTLIAHLMFIALKYDVEVWLETTFTSFIVEGEEVKGIRVERNGQEMELFADAIIVAAGGFSHNEKMRAQYHQVGTQWSSANPHNTGDAIIGGMALEADMALLDDAWWGPSAVKKDGTRLFLLSERSVPHTIIVDQDGYRYFNESASYIDAGHAMLERNKDRQEKHSWMILDARHRKRFMIHTIMPYITPKSLIEEGFILKARDIEDLAQQCRIPVDSLKETFRRFNHFVDHHKDEDFGRGDSAYDNYYGDPTYKNPNLGKMEKAPFWAIKVYPGDLGTKGGFITNVHGQVLKNGEPIKGLYATGNSTASVMGRTYPGAGSTLGPTMAFGYAAAKHILSNKNSLERQAVVAVK